MRPGTSLEDLIGLGHTKLGFFKEVQIKIKELRESNLELAEKQKQIQAILDGITDVMAVISPEFRILSVNHVFFRTFEHPSPEGEFCYRVFRGQDRPCVPCPVVEALSRNGVCRHTYIDSRSRHFELTASPLQEVPGIPRNVLLFKRDVTAEKEYQAQYYHAEKMATIGLLAAGVAHEINNPLTAISGFAEGLKRRVPRLAKHLDESQADRNLMKDVAEYIQTIMTECDRCRDIVRNLLTFSPRRKICFVPVDLNRVVMDVLKLLEYQLKKRLPRAICLDIMPGLPQPQGVVPELKQVVLNLVLNALDAVEDLDGKITVRTACENDWITLTVADTGCGIPLDHQDKLFEPFFTTKPVGKGIGIGLSTCYNIIRQHGGEIVVTSDAGQGAAFTVRLPMNHEDTA